MVKPVFYEKIQRIFKSTHFNIDLGYKSDTIYCASNTQKILNVVYQGGRHVPDG